MGQRFALVTVFGILTSVSLPAVCVTTAPDAPGVLAEQFERSTAVFVGRAIKQEFEKTTTWMVTTFEVEQMWKGRSNRTVHVRTDAEFVEDSFVFRVGSTYLVFASDEPLQTSSCHPTSLVERAGRAMQWLLNKPRIM